MAGDNGDKKHLPTERRKAKAREEGQIPKSQDLTSAALLAAAIATLWAVGGQTGGHLTEFLRRSLSEFQTGTATESDALSRVVQSGHWLAWATLPVLVVMFIAAVAINIGQVGLVLVPSKLAPKLNNVSPLSGLKRIFSVQGTMRLAFGVFKVSVIAIVAFVVIRSDLHRLMDLPGLDAVGISGGIFHLLLGTTAWIALALLILALAEYAFQRWKHSQDLMMTDQEMRDEMKENEGDPQMIARRRQIQRQLMMQRAETEVPKADVVVSNPTELAVAIQYDATAMPAPIVLAKGAGPLAQKIRRIALENGIPVVERKPLAQALYKSVDVGAEVPPDQYQAVAEVLRYVYQLKGQKIPSAA